MSSSTARSAGALRYRRWYYTAAWRQLRDAQLQRDPWCAICRAQGRTTPGRIVDHRRPHKGNGALFFDAANLQTLCEHHHNSTKQIAEARGRRVPIGADGWPITRADGGG